MEKEKLERRTQLEEDSTRNKNKFWTTKDMIAIIISFLSSLLTALFMCSVMKG